jgi:hypothetical protein
MDLVKVTPLVMDLEREIRWVMAIHWLKEKVTVMLWYMKLGHLSLCLYGK